jgi:7-carboxy-7-deazaguanine synthase
MNTQKPEKTLHGEPAQRVWVHSTFSTIQGEGPFTGLPAFFVRLAGCNLQCPACDTEYTSKRVAYEPIGLVELVHRLRGNARLVVITGGEPCRQPAMAEFAYLLAEDPEVIVQIETNGSLTLPFPGDKRLVPWGLPNVHIVCSPKAGKVHPSVMTAHNLTFKYVIQAGDIGADGLPNHALEHPANPRLARPPSFLQAHEIYINPLDEYNHERNLANLRAAKESCLKHGYRLGIQLHKLIGVE